MSVNDVTPVRDPRWPERVEIYDTTLRDGSQLEGISLTVDDKLRIAERLDWLGVDFIEAGWPGANPKDDEFFRRAPAELPLDSSILVAFGSTRRVKGKVDSDDTLRNLLAAGTSTVCIGPRSASSWWNSSSRPCGSSTGTCSPSRSSTRMNQA